MWQRPSGESALLIDRPQLSTRSPFDQPKVRVRDLPFMTGDPELWITRLVFQFLSFWPVVKIVIPIVTLNSDAAFSGQDARSSVG